MWLDSVDRQSTRGKTPMEKSEKWGNQHDQISFFVVLCAERHMIGSKKPVQQCIKF